jgi:hypothetical protein
VERTNTEARHRGSAQGGTSIQIPLAPVTPPSGYLNKSDRKLGGIVRKRRVSPGNLLITDDLLAVDARTLFRGRLEIPLDAIRKAVVDDGSRWGYVAAVCRFPVYDFRSDGSGSGTLIGPLWSHASSLMPAGCPVRSLEPVPDQAPNLILIFDRALQTPSPRDGNGRHGRDNDPIVALLLRLEDPDAAAAALASRVEVSDIGQDDLAYLNESAGPRHSGNGSKSGSGGRKAAAKNGAPRASHRSTGKPARATARRPS